MYPKFHHNISQMIASGDKLLAAVSGGVDSMVMLDLLVKSVGKERVEVAHCNFKLRPGEADIETQLVEQTCLDIGLKCHVAYFDTKEYSKSCRISTQEAARELRYEFFNKLLIEKGLDKIVIAHNQDDTIETFFINLLRGTGLRGLRGISPNSGQIIRPLMFASRVEIEKYALQNGVKWLVDSSNLSDDYMRNNLRNNVIPMLKESRVGFSNMMENNMERLRAHYDFEQTMVEKVRSEIFDGNNMSIAKFVETGIESQFLLFSLLEKYGFSWEVCGDIFRCIRSDQSQGKIFFSPMFRVLIDRGVLIVDTLPQLLNSECIAKDDARLTLVTKECVENLSHIQNSIFVDAMKLQFPLVLRPWREGDKFTPFGMNGASKKVSDLLTDLKINRFDKERVRVLLSGDEIVWVVGFRSDHRFRITAQTEQILRITL